jgi:hypothetical protein
MANSAKRASKTPAISRMRPASRAAVRLIA